MTAGNPWRKVLRAGWQDVVVAEVAEGQPPTPTRERPAEALLRIRVESLAGFYRSRLGLPAMPARASRPSPAARRAAIPVARSRSIRCWRGGPVAAGHGPLASCPDRLALLHVHDVHLDVARHRLGHRVELRADPHRLAVRRRRRAPSAGPGSGRCPASAISSRDAASSRVPAPVPPAGQSSASPPADRSSRRVASSFPVPRRTTTTAWSTSGGRTRNALRRWTRQPTAGIGAVSTAPPGRRPRSRSPRTGS